MIIHDGSFLHYLMLMKYRNTRKSASFRLIVPWFGLVVAAIAVPWATFSFGDIHLLGEVVTLSALWKVFWPLLVGGLLALALRRWRAHMPAIPNGDVVVLGGKVANTAAALSVGCGRLDDLLRRWQVAGTLLVSAIILLHLRWVGVNASQRRVSFYSTVQPIAANNIGASIRHSDVRIDFCLSVFYEICLRVGEHDLIGGADA